VSNLVSACRSSLTIAWSLVVATVSASASDVKRDEWIVFFPMVAHRVGDGGEWGAVVHGWVYEPAADSFTRNVAMWGVRKMLGLPTDRPSTEVFERRAGVVSGGQRKGKTDRCPGRRENV